MVTGASFQPTDRQVAVLHLIQRVGRASFGLGPIAMQLAKSQCEIGARTAIWSLELQAELEWARQSAGLSVNMFRVFAASGPNFVGYSPALERAIAGPEGQKYDVLHQHSIWTALSHASTRWRKSSHMPVVISPQGALDAWALRKSKWKKRLALAAYEWQNLRGAACLHALSEAEQQSIRDLGLRNPVAIIPNGISEAWLASSGDARAFRTKHGILDEQRLILFLSRITPKKGLPIFLEAMASVRHLLEGWLLVIAGVDEFNHLAEVKATVERLKLQGHVRFVGPLFDQAKRDAFAAADLFVLPSYSEGAPMVILEALGASVPVLATHASPWEALVAHRCGWWTPISADGLAEALAVALVQSPSTLREMGQRGHQLVRDDFTWSKVGLDTLRLYSWLLGRVDPPSFVRMD